MIGNVNTRPDNNREDYYYIQPVVSRYSCTQRNQVKRTRRDSSFVLVARSLACIRRAAQLRVLACTHERALAIAFSAICASHPLFFRGVRSLYYAAQTNGAKI